MVKTVNNAKVDRRAGEAQPRFEQVLTAENETFLWRIDDYPWARSVWNFHPEFEIHLIRKSTGTVFIGDYIGEFSPGHLTIVGSGLPHNWVSHIRTGEIVAARDLVVQFDPEKLKKASTHLPEVAALEKFFELALRGILFSGDTARIGADALEAMGNARGLDRLNRFLQLLELLATSSTCQVLSSPEFFPDLNSSALDIMQRCSSYIYDRMATDLSLPDVAKVAGMTESTFSRFFQTNSGRSFTDYLTELRIGRACRLLAETQQPVSGICYEVGYLNLSNFNRNFLKRRGMTPSQYRDLALRKCPPGHGPCPKGAR
ncbi:AraC family transcriptional regulator [Bradyrhizobium sp. WSM2254]|uniref:AraC family transcriptional regulator n=1 Tax=Bradyrhizobium sp. WSM2254 TaxID=1188263 RepID=UPI000402D9CF|nr:AraC family transcriptional regulator [Bradyrhizobium sp. WSM2254]